MDWSAVELIANRSPANEDMCAREAFRLLNAGAVYDLARIAIAARNVLETKSSGEFSDAFLVMRQAVEACSVPGPGTTEEPR